MRELILYQLLPLKKMPTELLPMLNVGKTCTEGHSLHCIAVVISKTCTYSVHGWLCTPELTSHITDTLLCMVHGWLCTP
jgi:hypothetical protein